MPPLARCWGVVLALLLSPATVQAGDSAESLLFQEEPPANENTDYLILAANDLRDVAADWAAYRSRHGRSPRVMTVADVSAANGGATVDPDLITAAVERAARDEAGGIRPGFQLLLLGGVPPENTAPDPDTEIPWRMTGMDDFHPDPARRRTVPTDHVYATFSSGTSDLPDIAVGRVPARTPAQARAVLEKVMAYEAAPEGPWLRRLTFFAGEGRFGPAIDGLLESLFTQFAEQSIGPAFDLRMTYANPASGYAYPPARFSQKVIEEANAGGLLLVYLGHGLDDRLDNMRVESNGRSEMYSILEKSDVEKFAIPDGKLPIMLILACRTGALDYADGCLAEAISFQPGAPVALLASSRDSHPYSMALLKKAFMAGLSDTAIDTVGEAMLNAKREMILGQDPDRARLELVAGFLIPDRAQREAMNRTHLALFNLIGDPGLRIRRPSLRAATATAAWQNGGVQLRVSLSGEEPLEGVVWDAVIETRRSVVTGDLQPVNPADLASSDPSVRERTEKLVSQNHATANNKRAAGLPLKAVSVHAPAKGNPVELVFEGKPSRPLEPGAYIIKLTARDPETNRHGFTAAILTVGAGN